jgi:glycosyltransferase involved in cell wall biosynthesis
LAEGISGRGRARTRIVYNGLPEVRGDAEKGRRRLDAILGPPPAQRIVILVAPLSRIKGHRELIAVADALRERVPGVRIVFVGGNDPFEPEVEDELRREVGERGVDDMVSFLGWDEEAHDLIAASDVLVLPTVVIGKRGKEGFPYVGLETMALGTPIVAYAHGGVPEQLGECGLLVPPGNREALRDKIARVLLDDELRARMSACGRTRVAEHFTLDRWITAMRECYRDVAGERA